MAPKKGVDALSIGTQCRRVLRLDPEHSYAHHNLGILYRKGRSYREPAPPRVATKSPEFE